MTYPHLNHAPIVEGLIDIQVKQRAEFSLDDLVRLKDDIKSKYTETKDLQSIEAGIRIKDGKRTSHSFEATKIGYRLECKNPPFAVLLRRNGLTVSRLKPYDDWGNLVAEAKPIWEKYLSISRPVAITRIATRYINRIELPIDGLDFDDYLAAPPQTPKDLSGVLSGFLLRLIIPDPTTGADIAIVQALESPNMQTRTVSVLIDIDVFKTADMEPSSSDLWKLLDDLRTLKNRAFFGSITAKTLELLK